MPQDSVVPLHQSTQKTDRNHQLWFSFWSFWKHSRQRRQGKGLKLFRSESRIGPRESDDGNFAPVTAKEDTTATVASTTSTFEPVDPRLESNDQQLPQRPVEKDGKLPEMMTFPLSKDSSGMTDLKKYPEIEQPSGGYIPPEQPLDCTEFTSSAVIIKDQSGKLEAVKLFYDTMSTDNWVSEGFVKTFGFQKRPILPHDLRIYGTVSGDFTPTHYIEIEVLDKSRGMVDFTRISLNVTPSMDGIGLVAGRHFMRKHRIKIDPAGHRDGYVTTSRKASGAAKEAKRLLLEKAKAEYNLAKEIAASNSVHSKEHSATSKAHSAVSKAQSSTSK